MAKHFEHRKSLALAVAMLGAGGMGVSPSNARAAPDDVDALGEPGMGEIEEVVSLGTRTAGRSALDTPVPIDVFNMEQLESVQSSDMLDVMSTLVPSFNVGRQPISDGASFIRPPQMRGLDSDKTLVLVNGKRRHRGALVVLGGFGSHGPDLGTIPSIGLSSVEVLRDGAAAQYGSDAIAGVLNFNLREDSEGFELRGRVGQYMTSGGDSLLDGRRTQSESDGDDIQIDANLGLPLTDRGFVNISANYARAEPTSRSEPYNGGIRSFGSGQLPSDAIDNEEEVGGRTFFGPDAFTYTYDDDGNLVDWRLAQDGVPDDLDTRYADNYTIPAQIWGQPDREQVLLFINSGIDLTDSTKLYAFANYSTKDQEGGFFYRRPGVDQLLPVRTPDGSIYDPRITGDGLYPAGFTPQFGGEVTDYSFVGGVEGFLENGLTYDVSGRYGYSDIEYSIRNTMNPSLGPQTPTSFQPGTLITDELAFNADFSFPVEVGFATPMNVGFGFEYREEGYEIEFGDAASRAIGPYSEADPWNFSVSADELAADGYTAQEEALAAELGRAPRTAVGCYLPGDLADPTAPCDPGDALFNRLAFGSNGFPGYFEESDYTRDSVAGYLDLEADVTEGWLVNAAVRYEEFSDFGDALIWKLATRYDISDMIAVRGSVGTGFRAPTPGQISTVNVSTRIANDGTPVAEGVFPADNPLVAAFNAQDLDSEDSFSYTFGVTATPSDNLTLTADYYFIELTDRTVLSSDFTFDSISDEDFAAIREQVGPLADVIDQVSFFTNDLDTETTGLDIVATYDLQTDLGFTQFSASYNWNRTEIVDQPIREFPDGSTGTFVAGELAYDEQNQLPRTRGVFSVRHVLNQWNMLVRANYFGEHRNTDNDDLDEVQVFSPEVMVDAEITYNFNENYSLTAGGQNIFDNYPDRGRIGDACCGRIYPSWSVVPWQGSFFFLRGNVRL